MDVQQQAKRQRAMPRTPVEVVPPGAPHPSAPLLAPAHLPRHALAAAPMPNPPAEPPLRAVQRDQPIPLPYVARLLIRRTHLDFDERDPGRRNAHAVGTSDRTDALSRALIDGDLVGFAILVADESLDTTHRDERGRTTLHYAALLGIPKAADTLVRRGFDINARDDSGATALHCAVRSNWPPTTKALLELKEVNVNAVDGNGKTALMLAAENGNVDILRMLIAMPGLNVNAFDASGKTALMLAAENGHRSVVRALLPMPGIALYAVHRGIELSAATLAYMNRHERIARDLDQHMPPAARASDRVFQFIYQLSSASQENGDVIDAARERLESGSCAAAAVPALFESIGAMSDQSRCVLVQSLAFGFRAGHFRTVAGELDDAVAALINTSQLRQVFDSTVH
ncbi:ankyrin repeat domain-containing protein [Noviherbaspirillum pedocola]|uniref:Ankyrin repeat domain-containing protein n=1 Tax=Noviherbaspirillum pedocola TaxID=2801341 RepID=A0A934SZY2_9BURK|nr:ankyrin repeat domain-containing protein [Noviherbaspirillum pedocola]MBK4738847.1 ankyrin repeat domain-containing protein [Noviherbaspirillum pedocola]